MTMKMNPLLENSLHRDESVLKPKVSQAVNVLENQEKSLHATWNQQQRHLRMPSPTAHEARGRCEPMSIVKRQMSQGMLRTEA